MIHRPRKRLDLGEPGHHRRSVERNEAGQVVERELRRRCPSTRAAPSGRRAPTTGRGTAGSARNPPRRSTRRSPAPTDPRRPRSGRRPGPAGRRRARARLAAHSASREPRARTLRRSTSSPRSNTCGNTLGPPHDVETTATVSPAWSRGGTTGGASRRGTLAHPGPDHAWSSRMLPSGSVRYVHVTRRPSDVPVVTTSPITPPPSASTASRAAATSGTANAMCPKPGRLIAVAGRSGSAPYWKISSVGPFVAESRQAQMRAADRGARHAGPGLEDRAAEVALGRHEDAAEDALVEVGEQPPVGGDEIDVSESRVDHDGPSSRRPRTQAPRTMSGCGRKISRLDEGRRIVEQRGILRRGAAQRRRHRRVDDDQVGLLARLDRADRRPRGRAPAPPRSSRAGASRAAPSAGRGSPATARSPICENAPTRITPKIDGSGPPDTSDPSPTAMPASSQRDSGITPAPMNRFEAGQWATRVPVSTMRAPPRARTGGSRGRARTAAPGRPPGRRRRRSRAPPGTAARPPRSRPRPRTRAICHHAPVERASDADSRSSSAVHETANRGVTA